jgi:hypothetical protein
MFPARRISLSFLAYLVALTGATMLAEDSESQGIPPDAAGGTLQRGVPLNNLPHHPFANASGASNLIDHGGRIVPNSNIYYIWWGNQNAWPTDATAGLTALASGLNGSSFLNGIFPQYMRVSGVATAYKQSLYDASAPPTRGPKTSTIVAEACKVISANGLNPDPTAIYMVLTSNFPGRVNYCAWHSYGNCNGTTIQVAYLPNTTGVSGCNDPVFSCNGYSQGTNSIANVLSHEFSEAITDATASAWYDSSGSEIGDKCAWQFQSCVNLTSGSWQLQMEWSNSRSGCLQQ